MFTFQQDRKEKLEKITTEATATVIYLNKLATLISNKKFHAWYVADESRFEWAEKPLHDKLRYDFEYQLHQMLDREFRDVTISEKFNQFAAMAMELSDKIEHVHGLKITKKDKKLTFPRGSDTTLIIIEFLSRQCLGKINKELCSDAFYIWNSISSLVLHARARDTMTYRINNAKFEQFLAVLTTDYMVKGYPKDILSHDAESFRNGTHVRAIVKRRDYCSTYIIVNDQEIVNYEDGEIILFHEHAKKAA